MSGKEKNGDGHYNPIPFVQLQTRPATQWAIVQVVVVRGHQPE